MNPVALVLLVLSPSPTVQSAQSKAQSAAEQVRALTAVRRELAEVRLLIAADRKYAEARDRIAKLKEALADRSEAEAKELLAEVRQLDQDVRRALGESVPTQDTVDDAVERALLNDDVGFLTQLGTRAVPGLAKMVRANVEFFPGNLEKDPLVHLARLDPLAASELAGEMLDVESFFWKKRVGRVFSEGQMPGRRELWTVGSPQHWLGEGFQKTAEKYCDDPDIGRSAMRFLADLARRGHRSTVLEQVLDRDLRSADSMRRERAQAVARENSAVVGRARLEALLGEEDASLREFAARELVENFRESRLLVEHAGDSSASVRRALAEWLSKTIGLWQTAEREALARLLHDPDVNVREKAWDVLSHMEVVEREVALPADQILPTTNRKIELALIQDPLPDDVYRRLLTEEDWQRRKSLALIAQRLPAPLCYELLEVLAGDRSPEVLAATTYALSRPPDDAPEAALRALSRLLANEALSDRGQVRRYLGRIANTRAGLEALIRWALAHEDRALADEVLVSDPDFSWNDLVRTDPETVVAFVARLFEVDRSKAREFFRAELWWRPELSRAFRELARDGARPVGLRSLALLGARKAGPEDEDFRSIARSLASSPAWRDPAELGRSSGTFVHFLDGVEGELGNALILQVLRNGSLPEELAISAGIEMDARATGAAEIVALVLARGAGKAAWDEAMNYVFGHMSEVPALQDAEALARGARDPDQWDSALGAIEALRDPRYLPLLAEIVDRPADAGQLAAATRALFGYLDAEAVEPLLRAATKVQGDMRNDCLSHLEKIREYQQARELWATRQAKSQTREQVVARLVEQLGAKSDDVKVQAIRALATWEAVEAMPRLIELTTSGSKTVAAAARDALDRLNAPNKE